MVAQPIFDRLGGPRAALARQTLNLRPAKDGLEIISICRSQPVDLVLVPVWVASYRHAGKPYRLLVHGQDGRCVGRPPISPWRRATHPR